MMTGTGKNISDHFWPKLDATKTWAAADDKSTDAICLSSYTSSNDDNSNSLFGDDSAANSGATSSSSAYSSDVDDADDDASSSSASSSSSGPLYELSDLMAQLPIRRGLSKFYHGKSQSFTILANATSLNDLAKVDRTPII